MAKLKNEDVQDLLEEVVTEAEVDGLLMGEIKFDFYTESYQITFSHPKKNFSITVPSETIEAMAQGDRFKRRQVRYLIKDTLGPVEE